MKKLTNSSSLFHTYIRLCLNSSMHCLSARRWEKKDRERNTKKKRSRDAVGDHCCHYKVTVTSSNSICQYSNSESKCSSHTTRAHARNYTFRINALRFQRRKLWHFFSCVSASIIAVSLNEKRGCWHSIVFERKIRISLLASHTRCIISVILYETLCEPYSHTSPRE